TTVNRGRHVDLAILLGVVGRPIAFLKPIEVPRRPLFTILADGEGYIAVAVAVAIAIAIARGAPHVAVAVAVTVTVAVTVAIAIAITVARIRRVVFTLPAGEQREGSAQ